MGALFVEAQIMLLDMFYSLVCCSLADKLNSPKTQTLRCSLQSRWYRKMSVNFLLLFVRILQVRTIYLFAAFKTEYDALHNVPQPWCSHLWHKYLVCNYSEKIPMICLLDCYMTSTTLLCLILKFYKNIRMKTFKITLGLQIFQHSYWQK